jgi:HSP20 family molecular chaperone IbpA
MANENENNENLNEDNKQFNETVDSLRNMGKEFFNTMAEMGTEIIGEDFTKVMKEKSSDVQTKVQDTVNTVKEQVVNAKTNMTTETLMPEVSDSDYTITLFLAGLPKKEKKISLSIEDDEMVITIDSSDVDKSTKEYWSVSKDRLSLDLSEITDYNAKDIKATHKDGVFTVVIPRIEKEVVKTDIEIN